jgi:aminodeoxychorismate lyase
MLVFLNGRFLPAQDACVSIFDRGFLYGDGLFETLKVVRGKPFRWEEHMDRLQRGALYLYFRLPFTPAQLLRHATTLIQRNRLADGLLRITLSRGVGLRGYSPRGANKPTLAMTLHPAPDTKSHSPPRWSVITASCRLPAGERLAEFKTCNKLPQIIARAEADAAGADEALLLNTRGHVVEATSSNLFWIAQKTICTPPLQSGILAGVTRIAVREICRDLGLLLRETRITPARLKRVQGIFLSLSSWGVVEIVRFDGQAVSRSPLTAKIRAAYETMLQSAP